MSRSYWLHFSRGVIALALALVALPVHAQGISRTVTLADYGQTLSLQVGDRFLLVLGGGYTWTMQTDDPAIVTRVADAPVSSEAQGVYEAAQPGATVLTAAGRPSCPDPRQPCSMLLRGFRVQFVVQ